MNRIVCVILSLVPLLASAGEITPYEWEKDRSPYKLSASEEALPELVLKQHSRYEYVVEDNQFLTYVTFHRIIRVNNTEAIQKHNRIVISMYNTIDLTDLKARVINKDGKPVYFDKSNLKELKEEATGNAYRIFAMEGVELGSEIEYFFVRKMGPNLFETVFLQSDALTRNSSFLLSCPAHLKFDFRSYNGYPAVNEEKKSDRNVYTAGMDNVPAIREEPFSFSAANRMRIEFKIAYNTAHSSTRMYTWEEAARTFHKLLSDVSKNDEKAIEKFIKTLNDDPSKDQAYRIKNIERKIKTGVRVDKESGDKSLSELELILKNKIASNQGITKLFFNVFNKTGIPCNPVITCSREKVRFDGDFDTWSYLDDYLLYFPDTKGFLAPYVFETRYPMVPPEYTAQKGLFLEPFSVGNVNSALSSIREIPAADYRWNLDNLEIDVTFDEDMSENRIRQKREFGGYNAAFFIPYYDLMTDDQRGKMVEEIVKQTAPDAIIKSSEAKTLPGNEVDNFLIDTDFTSAHFLEKAGPRILFKAGELIGPQVEMYSDNERTAMVENDYNRGYYRVIRIKIPDGYLVKNPGDLKMDVTYKEGDKTPYLFQSDYTLKENVLAIVIHEYYKEIFAPLSRYEDFRKVINAAADFNKVTLVFEKKK